MRSGPTDSRRAPIARTRSCATRNRAPASIARKTSVRRACARRKEGRGRGGDALVAVAGPAAARRPLLPAVLPEWLTAGVGGFVRGHPTLTAFVALLGGAALVIGMVAWERPAESLMRGAHAGDADAVRARLRERDDESLRAGRDRRPRGWVANPDRLAGPRREHRRGSRIAHGGSRANRFPVRCPHAGARCTAGTAHLRGLAGPIPPDAGAAPHRRNPRRRRPPSRVRSPRVPMQSPAGADAGAPSAAPAATPQPLTMAEIDALSVAFVDAYDRGRIDAFAACSTPPPRPTSIKGARRFAANTTNSSACPSRGGCSCASSIGGAWASVRTRRASSRSSSAGATAAKSTSASPSTSKWRAGTGAS